MNQDDDIERLRASLIVLQALQQAMLEELPPDILKSIERNISFKFEHFTVRTINSTMPELFVKAQKSAAEAWLTQIRKTLETKRS